jgi:hypothetical protein
MMRRPTRVMTLFEIAAGQGTSLKVNGLDSFVNTSASSADRVELTPEYVSYSRGK